MHCARHLLDFSLEDFADDSRRECASNSQQGASTLWESSPLADSKWWIVDRDADADDGWPTFGLRQLHRSEKTALRDDEIVGWNL